jgi:hypothetical protein
MTMTDLRTILAATLADVLAADTADQLLAIRYGGGTEIQFVVDCGPLADAVIAALGLRQEWGSLDENNEGVLADTLDELKRWPGEKIKNRWITDWEVAPDE